MDPQTAIYIMLALAVPLFAYGIHAGIKEGPMLRARYEGALEQIRDHSWAGGCLGSNFAQGPLMVWQRDYGRVEGGSMQGGNVKDQTWLRWDDPDPGFHFEVRRRDSLLKGMGLENLSGYSEIPTGDSDLDVEFLTLTSDPDRGRAVVAAGWLEGFKRLDPPASRTARSPPDGCSSYPDARSGRILRSASASSTEAR